MSTTTVGAETAERSRLIDHFKRAYQIIVGLAITQACLKLFPDGLTQFPNPEFWMFCTFFVTIVPIFHGGDRSLDLKYLGTRPAGFWRRAAYVWDVYMLLITAIFFVKIAQALPTCDSLAACDAAANASLGGALPAERFYLWMGCMFAYDVFVLLFDHWKSGRLNTQGADKLKSYNPWVALNFSLAVVCLVAAWPFPWLAGVSLQAVSLAIFLVALARSFLDYVFGADFMFP